MIKHSSDVNSWVFLRGHNDRVVMVVKFLCSESILPLESPDGSFNIQEPGTLDRVGDDNAYAYPMLGPF